MKCLFAFFIALLPSSIALAQVAPPGPLIVQQPMPVPVVVTPVQPYPSAALPANTVVTLSVNDTVTTKGNRWKQGDSFDMTVTQNVRLGQYVVIPRGARGSARITWLTDKGAFGKSGKFEFDIEYVEVGDRRIPLSGHFRQEGEGNTVATVAGVVAVGVLAGFVTGKSGTVPAGRELTARTKEDVPVAFAIPPSGMVQPQQPVAYQYPVQAQQPVAVPASTLTAPYGQPVIIAQPPASSSQMQQPPPPPRFGNKRVKCDTCR